MIPKVIHYFWVGGKPIPEKNLKCIESWKKFCPGYKIVRHDETNYDFNKNKYMCEAYEHKKWGFVPDYARLDVIYNEGGIYLDTDVELVKPLDDLLECNAYMGFEDGRLINPGQGFAAVKHHKGIKRLMEAYNTRSFLKEDGTLDTTPSPIIATEVLKGNGLEINDERQKVLGIDILPTEFLCPKSFETGKTKITKNTYSIHHFDMSWVSEADKKRHRLIVSCKKVFGKKVGGAVAFALWYLLHPIIFVKKINGKIRRSKTE